MMRRSPTKIELRLDDLQEYEAMKKEKESKKDADKQGTSMQNLPSWGGKLTQSEIQERIGYVPQTPQAGSTNHRRSNMTL